MQVKLRLQRFGRKKLPFYRIVAASSAAKRDGKFLEILGLYHPVLSDDKQIRVDIDKIKKWLGNGAKPSNTVKSILVKQGIWKEFMESKNTLKSKKENQKK